MVPSLFVVLEKLPLSPTGKVDRGALPSTNGFMPKSARGFAAPSDELELKLTRIWEKVLNVRPVGVDDNFFDLGGHSLLAVRLFAQIEKSFAKNLPLATLFQAPTVKQLARVLRDEGWQAAWSSLVMIQGGSRQPFFCVHAAGGNVLEYRDLARRSEEHTSELQSLRHLVCRLLLEKKNSKHVLFFSSIALLIISAVLAAAWAIPTTTPAPLTCSCTRATATKQQSVVAGSAQKAS